MLPMLVWNFLCYIFLQVVSVEVKLSVLLMKYHVMKTYFLLN
jgi:hypothetical protein